MDDISRRDLLKVGAVVAGLTLVSGAASPSAAEADDEKIPKKTGANKGLAANLPTLKVGSTSMTLVGVNETTASPGDDYKFRDGATQQFSKDVGHQVVAAWPVIRDFHGDVPGNARFWRDWAGYFQIFPNGNSITFDGSPQNTGRYKIPILYLYVG